MDVSGGGVIGCKGGTGLLDVMEGRVFVGFSGFKCLFFSDQ